jgi:hypothetical protein
MCVYRPLKKSIILHDVLLINLKDNIGEKMHTIYDTININMFSFETTTMLLPWMKNPNNKMYDCGKNLLEFKTCNCGIDSDIDTNIRMMIFGPTNGCKGCLSYEKNVDQRLYLVDPNNDIYKILNKIDYDDSKQKETYTIQIRKGQDITYSAKFNNILKNHPDDYFFMGIRTSQRGWMPKGCLVKLSKDEYENIIDELNEINDMINNFF